MLIQPTLKAGRLISGIMSIKFKIKCEIIPMSPINRSYPFLKISSLLLLALMILGCASSELTKFKENMAVDPIGY